MAADKGPGRATPVQGARLYAVRRTTGPRPPEDELARRHVAPPVSQPEHAVQEAHASLFVDHLVAGEHDHIA